MKKIAILVIGATYPPLYAHYINSYWTEMIRHTRRAKPHIDIYLLFEKDMDIQEFDHLADHIIQDKCADLAALCPPQFQDSCIPGILSKTIYALELLQDKYDVFFRTNLSSVIRLPYFDRFVQDKKKIIYSGSLVWRDGLREDLENNHKVGPGKSIRSLDITYD